MSIRKKLPAPRIPIAEGFDGKYSKRRENNPLVKTEATPDLGAELDGRITRHTESERELSIMAQRTAIESQMPAIERPPSTKGVNILLEEYATSGKKYLPFKEFIERIREEERYYPNDNTNVKLMITRLRKIFYSTPGWENYLIPDRKEVDGRYVVSEGVTSTRPLHWALLRERTITGPQQLARDQANPKERGLPEPMWMRPYLGQADIYPQEVELPDGKIVDIGHVLAGLDAINFPSNVGHWSGLGPRIKNNAAAATWIGDLGSVVGETILVHMESPEGSETSLNWEEIQNQIDLQAPARDMMGNIDAYVIAGNYDMDSNCGPKVSDILEDYYAAGTRERLRPYSRFAEQIGLGHLVTGTTGNNESDWTDLMAMEVSNAATQYVLLQLGTFPRYGLAVFNGLPYTEQFVFISENLVVAFINALHEKVIQEKKG